MIQSWFWYKSSCHGFDIKLFESIWCYLMLQMSGRGKLNCNWEVCPGACRCNNPFPSQALHESKCSPEPAAWHLNGRKWLEDQIFYDFFISVENEIHGDENILDMSQGRICLLIHGTAKILGNGTYSMCSISWEKINPANEGQQGLFVDHPWC